MTPAQVREREGESEVEVVFLESARFYRLPAAHPDFARIVDLFRDGAREQKPVSITFDGQESDVIRDAHALP